MTLAGFFGLFDYNKPGPGVDKNAPRKKGFVIFFEIYFRKFWKLICVNLLYVLLTLPVFTRGLAQAGMTYITRNFAREKHAFISGDFFDTIKKNWKQALPVGIINMFLTLLLGFDLYFFYTQTGDGFFGYLMLAVIMMVALVFTFMKYYMSMMMITFRLSVKQLYKNSLIFAFAGLKRNLLIFFVLALCYAAAAALIIFGSYIGITIVLFLYIFLFPAFRSYLIQYNIFPLIKKHMIDPYYKEHPGEDKEAKRNLNLEDEEEAGQEDEPVFQDMGRTDKPEEEQEDKPAWKFPKQYDERERRKAKRYTRDNRSGDDDDDTI